MSARRFPLATLLRVRRLHEELARGRVGAAHAASDAAAAAARGRELALAARVPAPRATAGGFVLGATAGLAAAGALARADSVAADARHRVTAETRAWADAAGRVRVVEGLEQRHRETVLAQDRRVEQAQLDEIGAALAPRPAPARAGKPTTATTTTSTDRRRTR